MKFNVDGACRGNGQPGSIAVAACIHYRDDEPSSYKKSYLPRDDPVPTNQRAEISAIILALEWALERYQELFNSPTVHIKIHSDSTYAINCMTVWIDKWIERGWYNTAGHPVANGDLLQHALHLHNQITRLGKVTYTWIPREENQEADAICNEALDRM
ncbi:hypothetical protein ABW20_dc0102160 [Dactylellina cionopaga]|nr:hypothetical protein ABW20_dc0102160 [Dactylellina cionopaga]